MTKCIICGKENSKLLCENCRKKTDLEELFGKMLAYKPLSGENAIWDEISGKLSNPLHFKYLIFALSSEMETPRKEYWRVIALCGFWPNLYKEFRPWFRRVYSAVADIPGLSESERNRLHGVALGAYYMDYDYEEAEEVAAKLRASSKLSWYEYYNLVSFYTTTRRYDLADKVIDECIVNCGDYAYAVQTMKELSAKNAKQREKSLTGKKEYIPCPRENGDEVREKYFNFLVSIGVLETAPTLIKHPKTVIPRGMYPEPTETGNADFDRFVAFDVETTGLSPITDSIIEIGAIKVIGNRIVESEKFTFEELVHPLDNKKLSKTIEDITGITNEEVSGARCIWEVLPDFMNFCEDYVLLGFNCMAFDSRFMIRAGRYSNIVIKNKYFDVMLFADLFKERLGIYARKVSLRKLADRLGVTNPRAHRALADAITTAKVFLKLKEL